MERHPYADPRCGICRGTGSTAAKHPIDGEPIDVDCWCVDPAVDYPDPDEYVEERTWT